ncbi:hypothetical protein BHE74_00034444 [Ensete ventricosum]|nr:hypothetical protein BHE74_00034444 [Ensete ventricosum]
MSFYSGCCRSFVPDDLTAFMTYYATVPSTMLVVLAMRRAFAGLEDDSVFLFLWKEEKFLKHCIVFSSHLQQFFFPAVIVSTWTVTASSQFIDECHPQEHSSADLIFSLIISHLFSHGPALLPDKEDGLLNRPLPPPLPSLLRPLPCGHLRDRQPMHLHRLGGCRQLDPGQSWTNEVSPGTASCRVWARTGCSFDGSGHGSCETGDCGGLLECQAYGSPPNTLAEFSLNQDNNNDFIDISLVDGFNVPMDFSPTTGGCRGIRCAADINGQCPSELKASGGCNNPCTVFKTDEYCCNSGSCSATDYSKFFKNLCPDAYSYPKDDATSLFTCPGGTNYRVVFCP